MHSGGETIFPSLENFAVYLSDQRGIVFDSGLRSRFKFIKNYFQDMEFNEENFRLMLNKLRTTTELKGQVLKPAYLNKFIRVARLLALYMKLPLFTKDAFPGYKYGETKPLGDLISDQEMRRIAECDLCRPHQGQAWTDEANLRFRAAFTLMRFSGIPPKDLCELTWDKDKLTHFGFNRHKTNKLMRIPIVTQVRRLLKKLPHYSHNYVFGSSRGKMKVQTLEKETRKRAEALELKGHITPYSFRYSWVTLCYANAEGKTLYELSKISGHTIETAKKHYDRQGVQPLIDALYASHPGLVKRTSIDTIKRVVMSMLCKLIDVSKFEVRLIITPKRRDVRVVHLS